MKQSFPFLLIIRVHSDDVIGKLVLEFPAIYLIR